MGGGGSISDRSSARKKGVDLVAFSSIEIIPIVSLLHGLKLYDIVLHSRAHEVRIIIERKVANDFTSGGGRL
jgi:hypothetical protein